MKKFIFVFLFLIPFSFSFAKDLKVAATYHYFFELASLEPDARQLVADMNNVRELYGEWGGDGHYPGIAGEGFFFGHKNTHDEEIQNFRKFMTDNGVSFSEHSKLGRAYLDHISRYEGSDPIYYYQVEMTIEFELEGRARDIAQVKLYTSPHRCTDVKKYLKFSDL